MDVNKAPEGEQQAKAEGKEKQTVEFDPSRSRYLRVICISYSMDY